MKHVHLDSVEMQTAVFFSLKSMRIDPRNCAVPVLDVLVLPDDKESAFLIMPFLRRFHTPPFHCRAEFVEAVRQLFQVCCFNPP